MDNDNARGSSRVERFKNVSEADQRVIDRLVADRTNPRRPGGREIDSSALNAVFRRTLRETTDVRNIFKIMPDLNLPREILVSAVVAPGDLATTSLLFKNNCGKDTSLTGALTDLLHNHFVNEQKLERKVPNWIDDALIMSGSHPIMILPEASIDRLVRGDDGGGASMESVNYYGGEFENKWFKPKGIFGLALSGQNEKQHYISVESARARTDMRDMLDCHTIKVGRPNATKLTLPIRVTDNLVALRQPAVQKVRTAQALESVYGTPELESRRRARKQREHSEDVAAGRDPKASKGKKSEKSIGDTAVFNRFFKAPQRTSKNRLEVIPTLKQVGGKTVGHPLVYHLAAESVMPIFVPGDPTNHLAYIVALGGNGYPISFTTSLDFYDDIRKGTAGGADQVGSSSQVAGELLNMSKETIQGGIANASDVVIDRLASMHGDMIEGDILARLKSGMLGGDFELSRTDHIDRMLLARTNKNQLTTLLYVPAELMVYWAYDYNEYGIGRSILEDAKTLAAQRAAVMMASVIGMTRNSIPGKNIKLTVDESDRDPLAAVTFAASEAMALAFNQFPLGISSPQSLAEQLQMSAMSLTVSGNPRFPTIETEVTAAESSYKPVDIDFLNSMRSDLVRVFSLTPEMVDGVNQADFATSIVRQSVMLLKRVMVLQGETNPQIADYVRIFTLNSGLLIDSMMDLIEENKEEIPEEYSDDPEGFLEAFMNQLTVTLPEVVTDSMTKQLELYKEYDESLESLIAAYLKEEYFDGYMDPVTQAGLPSAMAAWKGRELRRWMRERGIFRDLDIFGTDEEGSPLFKLGEEMDTYAKSVMEAISDYSKKAARGAAERKGDVKTLAKLDQAAKDAIAGGVEEPEPEVPADASLDNGDDEWTDTGGTSAEDAAGDDLNPPEIDGEQEDGVGTPETPEEDNTETPAKADDSDDLSPPKL